MKKHLRSALIGSTALMMLGMSASWAQTTVQRVPNPTPVIRAPEIDVGVGGGAIALLVGILLLAAEKRRRPS